MSNQQPETIALNCENFGGHAEHWKIITATPEQDVGKWLHQALDQASSPMGLCKTEQDLPENVWLLLGPQQNIQVAQIVDVENNRPKSLKTAFPVFQSPYKIQAKITRILACTDNHEAVLSVELENSSVIYGYDTLYAVNQQQYHANQSYDIEINAWAYALEAVPDKETMLIEDPVAIRHHRALNDILADHHGETPDNLQELLAAWQPTSPDDELPVTLDISKMVAYLYGETMGQEDEAWFQGDIVGKTSSQFMDRNFVLYDVALMREEKSKPVIVRIAYPEQQQQFEIGDYIRGNIWIQFKIYDTTTT
ncbi:hypothetical protein GCM10023206_15290 [Acinetobacter puyangensis]|uniref:Uncharacterized protein n=1 Tax=Acinetobacter puyangensis TaxID=1096779 RepID=A0A240E7Z7_9GAMM|nr:hypothetical protein [Acinetobacter puyangensis]SNX44752.1 hypothetical protein SAMN05421731_104110 [Acinetobacter puyangensis]